MTVSLPTAEDVFDAGHRLAPYVRETPILSHPALDAAAGARVFVKAECLQHTGSFKIRGAMNRLLHISDDRRGAGVVAFSSGNHAQGIARAARLLGMPAIIVMPRDAPQVKIDGVRGDGGDIHFYDRMTESREDIAAEMAHQRGAVLVPSFDDPYVIAGQGTCGGEICQQMDARSLRLDHLVCCAGGGGLISGIALAVSDRSPGTKIWTAEPEGHDDWARSLAMGVRVSNAPGVRSICDAILTPMPGELTYEIGRHRLSGGFAVTDGEVRAAMRFAFRYLKLVVEPGGAAALAAVLRGVPDHMRDQTVMAVLTGGNVDAATFAEVMCAP